MNTNNRFKPKVDKLFFVGYNIKIYEIKAWEATWLILKPEY